MHPNRYNPSFFRAPPPAVTDPKSELERLLAAAVATTLPELAGTPVVVERPKQAAHGDYATNIALALAKRAQRAPRELAQALVAALPASQLIERVEIAGAGFINLVLTPAARQAIVARVLAEGDDFGRSRAHAGERVMVEFVSANPTGPLHVGHGRQAALGDAIANLLDWQGYAVTREFYYNDAGAQIENLALSVQARAKELRGVPAAFPADGYRGEYIREVAQRYVAEPDSDLSDVDAIRRFAVAELRNEQDRDLLAFGVQFDHYYLESSLYAEGLVDRTVTRLAASGRTYEQEGALWLRTTDYGDDKDRVMRKSDGSYTYFVPDVAYHVTKWERGFPKVINVQGSDHHGTLTRVRAGLQAMQIGIPPGYPDYVLHKMVTVMRGGEEVKISKRAGSYVTIRDLIDEAGRDAVRFFLVSRKADSEFVFDLDLARSQSDENPVYYVQYAHARIASILRKAAATGLTAAQTVAGSLSGEPEGTLARVVARLPEVIEDAAAAQETQGVTTYATELATAFHAFYRDARVVDPDAPERSAKRLALVDATRISLANALALLGISAPESM